MAEPGGAHLSIGEVLGLLLEEFPDVTISKIRFLESQGLIAPERTASGYRKFFDDDVELLRVILREQRERFLPLRVIKHRIDSGQIEKPDPTPPRGVGPEHMSEQPTAAHVAKHPAGGSLPAARPSPPATAPAPTEPPRTAPEPAPAPAAAAAPSAAPVPSADGAPRLLPGVLVNREELCAMAGKRRVGSQPATTHRPPIRHAG